MWISPKYQDTDFKWPFSLDDKIKIFEDSTMGWQLTIANKIVNVSIAHSGYAVLRIILSYFEMIAKHRNGYDKVGKSDCYFKQGVYSVFPELKNESQNVVVEFLDAFYKDGRCGLYHGSKTGPKVILTGELEIPIKFYTEDKKLIINPGELVKVLIDHFQSYVDDLRDQNNEQLRNDFEKRFDFERKEL